VSLDVRTLGGLIEFLAIGSAVHGADHQGPFFSTACSGQDLYCQIDAGYEPRHFVLGNVCYALGIGRGVSGLLRQFSTRGEVREFSDMYNHTRQLALGRLERDARERGCNAVVDISTRVVPMAGALEIVMVGTGSHHPGLGPRQQPATSELTGEELWNVTQMGYEPVRLVLGTSVYALGIVGGFSAMFKSLSRGEVPEITHLIHEARENCLAHIRDDATRHGADGVIGVKLFVAELGAGLIEVLAIGTAVKKSAGMKTQSAQLIPQAVIRDRDTFFDETLGNLSRDHTNAPAKPGGGQTNPAGCLVGLVVVGMMFSIPCLFGLLAFLFGGR
ncbi:MAG: heavy metal-binding domain-containing protein, partial [Gemmataceae bacterium]